MGLLKQWRLCIDKQRLSLLLLPFSSFFQTGDYYCHTCSKLEIKMSSHSQFSQSLGGPCFNLQVWSLFWINKRSMMTKGGKGEYIYCPVGPKTMLAIMLRELIMNPNLPFLLFLPQSHSRKKERKKTRVNSRLLHMLLYNWGISFEYSICVCFGTETLY